MIPRYTRPEIGAVWTQQAKMESWLEVELAATEAWAEEGVVPAEAAEAARANGGLHGRGGRRARAGHRPRRRRLRRRGRRLGRRARCAGSTTASPPPTCSTRRWPCSCAGPARSSSPGRAPTATRWSSGRWSTATRSASAAPTASTPSRPPSACAWPASPSRPTATLQRLADGLRAARLRQALRRGRHLRLDPAGGRGAGDGAARACGARTSPPRSCRATATRC